MYDSMTVDINAMNTRKVYLWKIPPLFVVDQELIKLIMKEGSVAGGQNGFPRGCNTIRLIGGGWMAFYA